VKPLLALFVVALLVAACGSSSDNATQRQPDQARTEADRPDDVSGPQVHLVYAVPSDGTDRRLDADGVIAASFEAAQTWLAGETGGRNLRLDTFAGVPDVSFMQLAVTDAEVQAEEAFAREMIESELQAGGLDNSQKLYLVYYEGGSTYACGSAAWPPLIDGNVAVLFLHGLPPTGRYVAATMNSPLMARKPDSGSSLPSTKSSTTWASYRNARPTRNIRATSRVRRTM
jgi:hypothetical protein